MEYYTTVAGNRMEYVTTIAEVQHGMEAARAAAIRTPALEYVTCGKCGCVQAVEMVQLGLCYLCASPVFVESGLK